MKIKLCGLTRSQDILAANACMPDYVGFVFADSRRQITPRRAYELRTLLHPRIQSVGVFVNAAQEEIARLYNEGIIDFVQLHGTEDEAYITALRDACACPIIKAVRVAGKRDILEAQALSCDFLLLDAFVPGTAGGSGKRFDYSLIPKRTKPFFLAGGINAHNLVQAMRANPYALDVSSGIETDGSKDEHKMEELTRLVRSLCAANGSR